jgi:hypothetical protein
MHGRRQHPDGLRYGNAHPAHPIPSHETYMRNQDDIFPAILLTVDVPRND